MNRRHVSRRTSLLVTAALLGAPVMLAAPNAAASTHSPAPVSRHEVYRVAGQSVLTMNGRGAGHGHGMSQWGAYGAAAVDHLSAAQILSFYYPHTTPTLTHRDPMIDVLLSATASPTTGHLQVRPAAGLTATYQGVVHQLPTSDSGQAVTAWRASRSNGQLELRDKRGGTWHTVSRGLGTTITFSASGSRLPVRVRSGSSTVTAVYRGSLHAELLGGVIETVDRLRLERYLQGVVPAEMPASWPAAALQAQAVAARSYAMHGLAHPKASWYDVDGDTRDQAYGGVDVETTATTAAVSATAGEVLESSGAAVLAQFDAADGGWTTSGGVDYLPAEKDPYDGAIANSAHAWTTSVRSAAIMAAWPALGSLQSVTVTGRDGHGAWGGRVTAVTLTGSRASVAVSGTTFQTALGLLSPWWKLAASS